MDDTREWFGEDVGQIFFRWDLNESDLPLCYSFPDVVMLYISMFCMRVSFGIRGESNGGSVIAMEDGWECLSKAYLRHKQEHPESLLSSACKCHVFSFCSREGNCSLPLCTRVATCAHMQEPSASG